ncbi:MAG: hypothetical protein V3V01_14545 [Acidimicrobiales bacterium]
MSERRTTRLLADQLRPLAPLGAVWFAALLLLLAVVAQNVIPYEQLLLDPTDSGGLPWYAGLVSNLGVLAWTTATVAAIGGAWVSRVAGREGAASMLRSGATLSALLLLDDLFQFHSYLPGQLGFPKAAFYALYMALTAWWVLSEHRELARTNFRLLHAAGFAFATSIAVDQFGVGSVDVSLVLEDAAKFLGVLAWALYFVVTTMDITRSIIDDRTHLGSAEPREDLVQSQ